MVGDLGARIYGGALRIKTPRGAGPCETQCCSSRGERTMLQAGNGFSQSKGFLQRGVVLGEEDAHIFSPQSTRGELASFMECTRGHSSPKQEERLRE